MTLRRPPIRVLHLIARLTRGGPGHSLLTVARAPAAGRQIAHAVASLTPPDPCMAGQLRDGGVDVRFTAHPAELKALAGDADIVQIDWWNSPWIYRALALDLPPMRLLLWAHVSCERAPQVLPEPLLEYPDLVVASCAHTITLPGLSHLDYISSVATWDRLAHVGRVRSRPFTVGYVGKLDFSKLHGDFVSLCAAVPVADARFIVCGTGGAEPTLRRQAARAGIAGRFELRGFVEDIARAFAEMDVLGYPLDDQTYAASELALQEAMYAGVPPVVMGPPALRYVVSDGQTGVVADTESQYIDALTRLHDRPAVRRRLAKAAREHARRTWSSESVSRRWTQTYERMMQLPKRRRPAYRLASTGAQRFIDGLGGDGDPFLASLRTPDEETAGRAERLIADAPDVLSTGDGGILNYRDHYPDDPHLRLWSGLVLGRKSHRALAAGEFAAAIRLGLDRPRVRSYLAHAHAYASR